MKEIQQLIENELLPQIEKQLENKEASLYNLICNRGLLEYLCGKKVDNNFKSKINSNIKKYDDKINERLEEDKVIKDFVNNCKNIGITETINRLNVYIEKYKDDTNDEQRAVQNFTLGILGYIYKDKVYKKEVEQYYKFVKNIEEAKEQLYEKI